MKAAIYIRVSSEKQARGVSLETQLGECRAYCHSHGWQVGEVFEDHETGRRDDRIEWQRLFQEFRRQPRPFGVVVYWKIDRMGRDIADSLARIKELKAAGIPYHAVTQPDIIGNPTGELVRLFVA